MNLKRLIAIICRDEPIRVDQLVNDLGHLSMEEKIQFGNGVSGSVILNKDESGAITRIKLFLKGLHIHGQGRLSQSNSASGELGNATEDAAHLIPDIFGVENTQFEGLAVITSALYNRSEMKKMELELKNKIEECSNPTVSALIEVVLEPFNSEAAFKDILTTKHHSKVTEPKRFIERVPGRLHARLERAQVFKPKSRRVELFKATYTINGINHTYTLGRDIKRMIPDRFYSPASSNVDDANYSDGEDARSLPDVSIGQRDSDLSPKKKGGQSKGCKESLKNLVRRYPGIFNKNTIQEKLISLGFEGKSVKAQVKNFIEQLKFDNAISEQDGMLFPPIILNQLRDTV